MALLSKRSAITDTMGPSGGWKTRLLNQDQEAQSFVKVAGEYYEVEGSSEGAWVCSLHPANNNRIIITVPSVHLGFHAPMPQVRVIFHLTCKTRKPSIRSEVTSEGGNDI